jgi:signal transduction histidine kinase
MTLVNRVSAFFLAALALALVGYSLVFYLLISNYLYRQFDDELHGAIDLLAASVEVEPDDAKWHPSEHGIDLNQPILNEVSWIVTNESGQIVDRSRQVDRKNPEFEAIIAYSAQSHANQSAPVESGDWRILQRELSAPSPKPITLREPHEYTSVRITVGRSIAEIQPTLNRLTWLVCVVPAIVLLSAAGIGRWFVGHALAPVKAMADRARSMSQADFGLRLPVDSHRDELSDLATAFNGLLTQLQSAFERQQRFAGDAAHQLRTPLTVLQGQIDVARRRERSPTEYQQTLDMLSGLTVELSQIVESLSYLARSDENVPLPNVERIELEPWLEQYMERWRNHARQDDISSEFAIDDAAVLAPPTLLTQLLDNLVQNAFKYSQPGTLITIRADRQGDRAVVSVKDQGIGIAEEDQEAIFEPFIRTASARQHGVAGIGLGLALAARIAQALHGTLKCESTPGKGSEFLLTLPLESVLSDDFHAVSPVSS